MANGRRTRQDETPNIIQTQTKNILIKFAREQIKLDNKDKLNYQTLIKNIRTNHGAKAKYKNFKNISISTRKTHTNICGDKEGRFGENGRSRSAASNHPCQTRRCYQRTGPPSGTEADACDPGRRNGSADVLPYYTARSCDVLSEAITIHSN